MINFKYFIEVKDGYKPCMELEEVNEIEITIQAKCRVDADRMFKALMKPDNIIDIVTTAEE